MARNLRRDGFNPGWQISSAGGQNTQSVRTRRGRCVVAPIIKHEAASPEPN
jgi:hypothetical protein